MDYVYDWPCKIVTDCPQSIRVAWGDPEMCGKHGAEMYQISLVRSLAEDINDMFGDKNINTPNFLNI